MTLTSRVRAMVPAQYANYVTASAVVYAGGKARKGAPLANRTPYTEPLSTYARHTEYRLTLLLSDTRSTFRSQ